MWIFDQPLSCAIWGWFHMLFIPCLVFSWYIWDLSLGLNHQPLQSQGLYRYVILLIHSHVSSSYNCQHDGTAKMHCSDVIMSATASQITRPSIVCITVCSYQRRYQSSASLAFVMGIHRWPVYSPHKGPVTQKMFPFDDIIMMYQINSPSLQDSGHIVPSWKVL